MTPPFDPRLARIRQRLDQKNPAHGLQDRLKKMKARQPGQRPGQSGQQQPGQAQIPWSGEEDSEVGALGRDRDFTNLSLNQREQGVKQQYGFDDKSNPYSRAAELQRSYGQARKGTLNSMASQGQLYSGSLSNARDLDRHNYETSLDSEKRNYQGELQRIADARVQAQSSYDEGVVGARAGALEDAISQRPDPATTPEAGGPAERERRDRERRDRDRRGGGNNNRGNNNGRNQGGNHQGNRGRGRR